jgi:hypothetical protein
MLYAHRATGGVSHDPNHCEARVLKDYIVDFLRNWLISTFVVSGAVGTILYFFWMSCVLYRSIRGAIFYLYNLLAPKPMPIPKPDRKTATTRIFNL